jgi:hypothetical protein
MEEQETNTISSQILVDLFHPDPVCQRAPGVERREIYKEGQGGVKVDCGGLEGGAW